MLEGIDPPFGDWGKPRLLYTGVCDDWGVHKAGLVVRRENEFLLEDKLIYCGPFDNWWPCEEGVLIQKDNQFLVNGMTPVHVPYILWNAQLSPPEQVLEFIKERNRKGYYCVSFTHPRGLLIALQKQREAVFWVYDTTLPCWW